MKNHFTNYFLIISLLFLSIFTFAETPKKLKQKFFESSLQVDKAPEESIKSIKIILKICQQKQYYGLASLCYNKLGYIELIKGNLEESINYFKRGVEIGDKSDSKSSVALNMGFIGYQYSNMNMDKIGAQKIYEAVEIIENNTKNDEFQNFVAGTLYSFLAGFENKTIKTRILYNAMAIENFRKTPDYYNKDLHLCKCYINNSILNKELKKYDEAIMDLKIAENLNNNRSEYLSGSIFLLLAEVNNKKGNFNNVIYYCNHAINYFSENNSPHDLSLVYRLYYTAYKNKSNKKEADKYFSEYQKVQNKLYAKKLNSTGKIYEKNLQDEEKTNSNIKIIGYIIFFLFLILIIFIIYLNYKNKSNLNAFRKFSSEIKLARIDKSINLSIIEAISEETEKKILKDLEKFENKKQYNQKGITLGKLATQLHTNVKYLSLIIKKYKTDNFNLYINKLWSDYIVDKLENDTN